MVPRAEPVPAKALVVEDLRGDLPKAFADTRIAQKYGVVVRTQPNQLQADIALKLRVANGTHTAIAHVMALSSLTTTASLSPPPPNTNNNTNNTTIDHSKLLIHYLDSLFTHQILPGAQESYGTEETVAAYDDWKRRLVHPGFGLSTFFIAQNGAAKGGIRIGPTVRDLVGKGKTVTCATAFALAAILRYLTPATPGITPKDGIYRGWLDGFPRPTTGTTTTTDDDEEGRVEYADGLSYHLERGWYEFRCGCVVRPSAEDGVGVEAAPLPEHLAASDVPLVLERVVRAYLLKSDGGDLSQVLSDGGGDRPSAIVAVDTLVRCVTVLYTRMVAGGGGGRTSLRILGEMADATEGIYASDGLATDHRALLG